MRHLLLLLAILLPACLFPSPKTCDLEILDTSTIQGAIIINEVMANPKGVTAFPETEYVELHNTTDKSIDLEGWFFCYGDKYIMLPSKSLEAGGFVVLYRSGREIHIDPPGSGLALDKFPSSLSNSGKSLSISDPNDQIVDAISYGKATAGVSLERYGNIFAPSSDSRGGTPGKANSFNEKSPEDQHKPGEHGKPDKPGDAVDQRLVMPSDIIFNELLPNPFVGASEYIELYNRSGKELPLSGLSVAIRKSDGSLRPLYSLSSVDRVLLPDNYILLTKSVDGVKNFYVSASEDMMCEVKLPILANTASILVLLRTSDNSVIDEVGYSSEWHSPAVVDERGVALERINPDGESQERSNWASASDMDGFGTPGYKNSQYGKGAEGKATNVEAPVYSEITKEYEIRYHLDQAGYTLRAWVFNTSGKRMAEISNSDLLGVDGTVRWDGLAKNGSKIRGGLYIFYAEIVHPQGDILKIKKPFLVNGY